MNTATNQCVDQGVIRFEAEAFRKRSDIQPADLAETDLRLGRVVSSSWS